jgi:deazaflavin-dependent oxidoreductase (nitroreductase family)
VDTPPTHSDTDFNDGGGMSDSTDKEQFLYLTTQGWKSGKPRAIEIWYVEHAGRYYIVSEHRERSHWVQNIQHNPAVTFSVGTQINKSTPTRGTGRVVDPAAEPQLAATVAALMDAKYEWSNGVIVELAPS